MASSRLPTTQTNNPFASASLYVGDLASDVTEATLFELFNAVGPVASIRVCRDASTRRSLGYAYVNFHSVQDAERALDTMNFTNIRGKQCRIMWSQRDPRLRQSGKGNIFVKNLHESIDNKTLYDTFSVFGNILSCKVVTDRDTGKSRGYGYVHYVDDKSAKKAIEGVNGMKISDREVEAELFKPREERIKNFKYTNIYVKYIPRSWKSYQLKTIFEAETGGKIDRYEMWPKPYGVSACLNFADHEKAKQAVEKLNGRETADFDLSQYDFKDAEAEYQQQQSGRDEDEKNQDEDKKTDDDTADDADKPQPSKLYVARAMKKSERVEYLSRLKRRKGGMGGQRSANQRGANLYVKNLSPEVDDEELRNLFKQFGVITSAKVMRDAQGKSRGFGFVAFEKKEAGTKAINDMTNTVFHGKPLYVSRAQTKAFRQTFIMKQLRNKRLRNNIHNQSRQQQPYMQQPPQQPYGGGYGGVPRGPQPPQQYGQYGPPPHQQPYGQPHGGPPHYPQHRGHGGHPQQQQMYAMPPAMLLQQQQQQMFQQQQQRLLQQQQAQQLLLQQQQSAQMSSIQQQQGQPARTMSHHSQQSQPAQAMQSGPQSASMYAPTQSMPRAGFTASQQMVGAIASQPHQSSVPTGGQHSVSQLSAGAGQASAPMLEVNPLTAAMLKEAKPAEKKRLIGERLFPKIQVVEPRLAGKITGMLLEMDNTELLELLSNQRALMNKINEALAVLKDHQQKQSQQNPQSTKNPSSQNPNVPSSQN
jgi:polyadenylate-binding protein